MFRNPFCLNPKGETLPLSKIISIMCMGAKLAGVMVMGFFAYYAVHSAFQETQIISAALYAGVSILGALTALTAHVAKTFYEHADKGQAYLATWNLRDELKDELLFILFTFTFFIALPAAVTCTYRFLIGGFAMQYAVGMIVLFVASGLGLVTLHNKTTPKRSQIG